MDQDNSRGLGTEADDLRRLMTYRQYLLSELYLLGAHSFHATEAVSTIALEHPEWDMDSERKTFNEWRRTSK